MPASGLLPPIGDTCLTMAARKLSQVDKHRRDTTDVAAKKGWQMHIVALIPVAATTCGKGQVAIQALALYALCRCSQYLETKYSNILLLVLLAFIALAQTRLRPL